MMRETIKNFENDEIFDFDEFLNKNQFHNPHVMERFLKDIYRELSISKKGITLKNFREFIALPSYIADKIFNIFDKNNSRTLNYFDFFRGMITLYNGDFQQLTKIIFDLYDFDKDGKIIYQDVLQIQLLILPSQHHSEEIFKCINDSLENFFEDCKYMNYENFVCKTECSNSDIFMNLIIYLYLNKPFSNEIISYYFSDKRIREETNDKKIIKLDSKKTFTESKFCEQQFNSGISLNSRDIAENIKIIQNNVISSDSINLSNNNICLLEGKTAEFRIESPIENNSMINTDDLINIFNNNSKNQKYINYIYANNENNINSIIIDKNNYNNNFHENNALRKTNSNNIRRDCTFYYNTNQVKENIIDDLNKINKVYSNNITKNIIKTPKNNLFLKGISSKNYRRMVTYTDPLQNEELQDKIKEEDLSVDNFVDNYSGLIDEFDLFEAPAEEKYEMQPSIRILKIPTMKNAFKIYERKMTLKIEDELIKEEIVDKSSNSNYKINVKIIFIILF